MNRKYLKRIAVVAIALSLVGGVALAPASMAASSSRYITISSDGSVKVSPDAVRLNATVSVVAGTNKDALAATSTSSSAVRAALLANGVVVKDIATQSVTVYPEYNYTQDKGSVLVGYRGTDLKGRHHRPVQDRKQDKIKDYFCGDKTMHSTSSSLENDTEGWMMATRCNPSLSRSMASIFPI